MSGRPWFKLYRRRSARFEALPMIARGLFNEILAAADEDGWLRLGTTDRSALWRHVGAHPGERRALSKHLDALIELGAVEETGEGWSIPSFDRYQGGRPARPAAAQSVTSGGSVRDQRASSAGPARAQCATDLAPNSPEPFTSPPVEEKEMRIDEKERERGDDPPPPLAPSGAPLDVAIDAAEIRIRTERIALHRRRHGQDPANSAQAGHTRELASWLVRNAAEHSRDLAADIDATLRGYYARNDATVLRLKHPMAYLAENPGRYLSVGSGEVVPAETTRYKHRTDRLPPSVHDPEESAADIAAALELFGGAA